MTQLATISEAGETPIDSHHLSVDVGEGVVCRMQGAGGGKADEVRTTNRAVARYFEELEAMKERTAYRNRPIKSLLDDKAKRIAERFAADAAPRDAGNRPMETCPACQRGAGMSICGLCEGFGWVTKRQAEDWRDTHAG